MLDLLISGGTVIDGSGSPRRRADVCIRAGRIVGIGSTEEPARRTIDASGKIVAPGFVDIHTHFDAQAFWDSTLSPAPLHGVTTVVGGNCGFSIAPLTPEAGGYLMRMLARVEGMPLQSLEKGVPWSWSSFGEYLDALDGSLAINAGFMVGHCALRRVVMGPESVLREAKESEIEAMAALLAESIREGGLGFSSTQAPTHNDGEGIPVPSRHAGRDELIALARVLRDHPGTALEFLPTVGPFSDEHMELMTSLSLAANRPLNWNVLGVSSLMPELYRGQLAASDYAEDRGAIVRALTPSQVMGIRLNFVSGFVLDALPGWAHTMSMPLAEKKRALADPAVRKRLAERAGSDEAGIFRVIAVWENMTIAECQRPENRELEGLKVGELAERRGTTPFDTLLDLALSEDLQTSFAPFIPGDDDESWRLRAEVWRDPRTVIGASDSGAHLDMIDTFTCTTSLLGPGVREKGLIELEEAIQQLTEVPARLYGIRERGGLQDGWWADVVVFDADRVGPGPLHTRYDLPEGAGRLYAEAEGIEAVVVNGVPIVDGKQFTDARPGSLIRSGRDTDSVEVPGSSH
jgi:N-acyl-D-aspartate/D-glutamate deacylase